MSHRCWRTRGGVKIGVAESGVHGVIREKQAFLKALRKKLGKEDNTYIQHLGGRIGQYGGNKEAEPENLVFDGQAEEKITKAFGDKNAKIYVIK